MKGHSLWLVVSLAPKIMPFVIIRFHENRPPSLPFAPYAITFNEI